MHSEDDKIFRREAVESRNPGLLGEIILVTPLTIKALILSALAFCAALIAILFFGEYTSRVTVTGQLMPEKGFISIYNELSGTVESLVKEGDAVSKGTPLFRVLTERQDDTGGVHESVSGRIKNRIELLHAETEQVARTNSAEITNQQTRLRSYREELRRIDEEIRSLGERVRFADEALKRFTLLAEQGMVPRDQLQAKQAELVDQKLRLQTIQRGKTSLERALEAQQADFNALPSKQRAQQLQLEQQITVAEQDLIESNASRETLIRATIGGVVTSLNVFSGQRIAAGRNLTTIIPASSRLQAQLYAPSSAIGEVAVGTRVVLRYEAFPFQKFGLATGKIKLISRAPISTEDIPRGLVEGSGPVFVILADLDRNEVTGNGRRYPLTPGLKLSADLMLERRPLYEWLLDPVRALKARMHNTTGT